jgi:PAS domain-containing protein
MKLRRQFILSVVIFSLALITISISEVILNEQIVHLAEQEKSLINIQTEVMNLGYLSDNFFLYQEETTLTKYHTTISSIIDEVSKLNSTNQQQQTLVNKFNVDLEGMIGRFIDGVTFLRSAPRNVSVRVIPEFQTAWNNMSFDRQSLARDSSLLLTLIEDQSNQLSLLNKVLVFAMFGLFGAYLIVNYLITYRRTMKSILGLKNGTGIIGSGNLEYQIKTDHKDEVGELADAFNLMTTKLKSITASKVELDKEIDKRKKVEAELRDSEQRWATTLSSIGDGVIATNTVGEITFLNVEAEKLTGWNN